MRKISVLLFLLVWPMRVPADQEQSTYAYFSSSQNGRYVFRMVPDQKRYYHHESGKGIMYYVKRDGSLQKMWSVSGWYAFRTYPSFRGEYLVRIGNWPRGFRPSHKDLAIAFYHRGRLVKRYSTKDLLRNTAGRASVRSVGHYRFWSSIPGFGGWNHRFTLITTERIRYIFDARTGKIISSNKN